MNTIKSTGLHAGVVSVSADRTLTEVRQLEAMAAKLLETARKLPAGPVCRDRDREIPRADRRAENEGEMSGVGISCERR